jgi:hypothetical protein
MNSLTTKFLQRYRQTVALLVFIFLISCSTNTVESPTATASPAECTSSPISTSSLIIESPTVEETVLPPENILHYRIFEISPELPIDIKPTESLVIWSDPLQLIRFEPQVHLETIPGVDPESNCLTISPDGNWLAHCPMSNDSPTGQWLIIQSADGHQKNKVPVEIYLHNVGAYGFPPWLDNQHLAFLRIVPNEYPREGYPIVIINPFTEKYLKLVSNYPDLQQSMAGPAGRLDFGYSDVVYDPSLNLVIFPSAIGGSYIVLWDRQSKSALAKIEGAIGYYPLWSPDAKQFVVPLQSSKQNDIIFEEWFRVSRDGQVEQLTHFEDFFVSSKVGSEYSWSPDSQKLAFWLDVSPTLCSGMNLALLDISTKQITNTCIPSRPSYPLSPIWSLDSRYIAVVSSGSSSRQTILVDTKESQAFDITAITDGSLPLGWLTSP